MIPRDCDSSGSTSAEAGAAPFPVSSSVLRPDSLRAEVARLYSIGEPEGCELLLTGANDTYLVTTRESHYILRVYGSYWRSAADIGYELELLLHLSARGVAVSVPVRAEDGSLAHRVLAPEGPRRLALFTYAEGQPMCWGREEHAYLAGQLAARIHTASDDFTSPHARCCLDFEYLIHAPLRAVKPFLIDRPLEWKYVERVAARFHEQAEDEARKGLDWGVCHGDMSDRNIHITPDQVVTVFDFDLCGHGWRAYDFTTVRRIAKYERNMAIWEAFVEGYGQTRPLAERDLAAVPLFQAIKRVWSFGTTAALAGRRGSLYLEHHLDYYLDSLRECDE